MIFSSDEARGGPVRRVEHPGTGEGRLAMAKPTVRDRSGWRPPGWRHSPRAYVLSVTGGVLILLGLVVLDQMWLALVGAALAVVGWFVGRRG